MDSRELVQRYNNLLAQQIEPEPDSQWPSADAQRLLQDVREQGSVIDNPVERELLAAWARNLGDMIYQHTGEFPAVRLAPLHPRSALVTYGARNAVESWLHANDYDPMMQAARYTHEFVGREWVFQNIEAWLDRGESKVFLLTGSPGSGKTSVLAQLIKTSAERTSAAESEKLPGTHTVHAAHFCSLQEPRTIDPRAVIGSLANQLSRQFEKYLEVVYASPEDPRSIVSVSDLWTRFLVYPLSELKKSKVVIAIDAMDDANKHSAEETLVGLLSRTINLPGLSHVRWLLTCRDDDTATISRFPNAHVLDLVRELPEGTSDIEHYVLQRLSDVPIKRMSPGERNTFAHLIAANEKGNFLYAKYASEALLAQIALGTDLREIQLPHSLSDLYLRLLAGADIGSKQLKRNRYRDEDDGLEEFFTNAVHQQALFEDMISKKTPSKSLLVLHGIGGVGKSTLLKMYRRSCKQQHIPVGFVAGEEASSVLEILTDWVRDLHSAGAVLPRTRATLAYYHALLAKVNVEAEQTGQGMQGRDFSEVNKADIVEMFTKASLATGPLALLDQLDAMAFRDWLRSFLSRADIAFYLDPNRRLTEDFLDDLGRANTTRIVLMIDTYEQMAELDDWVRSLVQNLPQNVYLVIAGRALLKWDRAWPNWLGRAEVIELHGMPDSDLSELVQRYYSYITGNEPDLEHVAAIVQFARHLPMAATAVVQMWVRYGVTNFHVIRPQVTIDLVDRILEGVPAHFRRVIEAAAVLRYFNADVLLALLQDDRQDDWFTELRSFPFILTRREGLAIHETVREIVGESLRIHTPDYFRDLHKRAASYYRSRFELAEARRLEQGQYLLEALYHEVSADEEGGIHLFHEVAEKLVKWRLLDRLRMLLGDIQTYKLSRQNSKLWVEYYGARLAHLKGKYSEAERIYRDISSNDLAELRLRSYAHCDLGGLLTRYERLGTPLAKIKATQTLEISLNLAEIDAHTVESYFRLASIAEYEGEWSQQIEYFEKAREFSEEHTDHYGLAYVYSEMKRTYARRGQWHQFVHAHEQGMSAVAQIAEEPGAVRARARLLGRWAWIWALMGRYSECEGQARESLELAKLLEDQSSEVYILRDLGWTLGCQGRFTESINTFKKSLALGRKVYGPHSRQVASCLGFYGAVLSWNGQYDRAEKYLLESLKLKHELSDTPGVLEPIIWLGALAEMRRDYTKALSYYEQYSEWTWYGRYYFECQSLLGLIRVHFELGKDVTTRTLIDKARPIAEENEYNDCLATLSLIEGHLAWRGEAGEHDSKLDTVLRYYKDALVYSLRYNPLLLSDVLSEHWLGTRTLLESIPSHCLRKMEKGRQVLAELRGWWNSGKNEVEVHRRTTISLVPEGMNLLEAEQRSVRLEPGDSTKYQCVLDRLEHALKKSPR
ncbi:MAG TPA: tetratricopeptide repeat protein [Chloroflexia bacterium]|jgi:tetratricopeptide (TPR) repeat protein/thymidylate kinase